MRHAVHDIVIRTPNGATTNDEGVATPAWKTQWVRGAVATLGAHEADIAAQRGLTATVVIDVPRRIILDASAEVDVSGTRHLGLDGTYQVVEVRPNQVAKRLICARYEVPEIASAPE